tara:strand:+ start:762 stop:998 length:237 start_codon:yes stop_codon:yes gene_type:complete
MNELEKALKEKNLILGTERVLKALRADKLKKVLLSENCPEEIKEKVKNSDAEVVSLDIDNNELGVRCKKLFAISVIGY